MSRVMIVEDMAIFREPIAVALEQEGFDVSRASNGKEALAELENARPDIILLDIAMPEMDGITFLEIIRKDPNLHELPVLLLTAVNDQSCILRTKSLNAQEYLVKSYFSLSELLICINKYINTKVTTPSAT